MGVQNSTGLQIQVCYGVKNVSCSSWTSECISKWTVLLGYLHDRKSLVCSNVPNFTVIGALFYRDPI